MSSWLGYYQVQVSGVGGAGGVGGSRSVDRDAMATRNAWAVYGPTLPPPKHNPPSQEKAAPEKKLTYHHLGYNVQNIPSHITYVFSDNAT